MTHPRFRTAAAALGLVALLAGCAQPAAEPSDAPSATATPSAAPTPTATASPEPSASEATDPTAGWQLVEPESGRTQFRVPADWTADVTLDELDGEPVDAVVVRRPDGQAQLRFSHAPGDIGGGCVEAPPSELLDAEPLALGTDEPAAFGAVAIELEDGRWVFGMGVTAEERLQEPLGCPFYFVLGGPAAPGALGGMLTFSTEPQVSGSGDASIWIVDSIDDARAYLETEEYATLQQILLSLEVRV